MRAKTKAILTGTAIIVGCLIATEAMAKSDKEFLSDAIKTDNAEIALGQLAAQKGSTDDVRKYGQMLVTDHQKGKQAAVALAPDLQVKPMEGLPLDARKEQKKLQGLSGADFDKEFAQFMIAGHKQAISEFQEKAGEGDRPVPQLAKETLPTLQEHLKMAEGLAH
jgi:putative membrane protein